MPGVSKSRAFEKLGVKLQCLTEANTRETTFGSKNWEFRIIEYSKNRDSTESQEKKTHTSVLYRSQWSITLVELLEGSRRILPRILNNSNPNHF